MQKTPYATYESFYNNDFPLIANLKDFNIHNLIYFLFIIFIIYAIAEVGYSYKSFIFFLETKIILTQKASTDLIPNAPYL